MNKNKQQGTERNRLDIEGSLSSILAVKLDRPESKFVCYNYRPDESFLVSAKKIHPIVQRSSLQEIKMILLNVVISFLRLQNFFVER